MRKLRHPGPILLLLVFVVCSVAQRRRRDPLTTLESDQLREVSPEPEKKLKLYVTFAQARLVAVDTMLGDSKFEADRGKRIHDLLEDFSNVVDEMDSNIDDYVSQRIDLRKALKVVIEGDADLQLKLRKIKEAASAPEAAKEARDYEFALTDASEAVNADLDNARSVLEKQIAAFAAAREQVKKKK